MFECKSKIEPKIKILTKKRFFTKMPKKLFENLFIQIFVKIDFFVRNQNYG